MRGSPRRFSRRQFSAAGPARTIREHIVHELRLQFLRASLAAHMQRAFLHRQPFVPRRQMHQRNLGIAERAPHDPPAVAGALEHPAIGAGAAIKRAGSKRKRLNHYVENCSRAPALGSRTVWAWLGPVWATGWPRQPRTGRPPAPPRLLFDPPGSWSPGPGGEPATPQRPYRT